MNTASKSDQRVRLSKKRTASARGRTGRRPAHRECKTNLDRLAKPHELDSDAPQPVPSVWWIRAHCGAAREYVSTTGWARAGEDHTRLRSPHPLNNVEVGTRLFMSRGTVKTHLLRVYIKPGVTAETRPSASTTLRSENRIPSCSETCSPQRQCSGSRYTSTAPSGATCRARVRRKPCAGSQRPH